MRNILKTNLYNKFYYDYVSKLSDTSPFLPSLSSYDWIGNIKAINPGSEHYQRIKAILSRQNLDLKSQKAKKNIEKLSDENSILIITGQQLGLLGSPLYTIYKIITTIKLAQKLDDQISEYSFIPVFWLESEDHDFQEISGFGIMDRNFNPKKLSYHAKDRGRVSIRHYQFEADIDRMISDLFENLLDTEFSAELKQDIITYFYPGQYWLDATRDLLKKIFALSGLLFFLPGDPEIKDISIPFYQNLLEKNKMINEAFTGKSEQLIANGYTNQVTNIPGKTFIHFEQQDMQRQHLYNYGDRFYFKNSDNQFSIGDINKLIEQNASSVSTSVVSRPLLQSWLLPVISYVAGPAEIAYWAQLPDMFSVFDLKLPCVYPRVSATLLEPKVQRYLKKYDLSMEYIPLKSKLFIDQFYRDKSNFTGDPIQQLNQTINQEQKDIIEYLRQVDPTLIDMGDKTIKRMLHTLQNLENRVVKAKEFQNKQQTNHLQQVHSAFFPHEMPQERFLTIVYFLNKFGLKMMDRLYDNLNIENHEHQIIAL